jgi:ribonuclease P protein component
MERIKRRQDFLEAARARSWSRQGVVVQARRRGDDGPPRVGFTVTRKLGSAVMRNRIRRRLKEAVRRSGASGLQAGTDYVFIGRSATAGRPFLLLMEDIEHAVSALNRAEDRPPPPGRRSRH